jgi:hypothetical protein
MKASSIIERLASFQRSKMPGGINLIARKGSGKDLAGCQALNDSLSLPFPEARGAFCRTCGATLLSNGTMHLFLVEDRAKPLGSRSVSFSGMVFATDAFCSEAQSTLAPYLGLQLATRFLSHELPVLSPEHVPRANAHEGLNVMLCFGGWKQQGVSAEQLLAAREKQDEAFHLALGGYRVKQFLAEAIGEGALHSMLDAGAHLRRDYSNYFRKRRVPIPKSSQRPYLLGLTREEAFAHPGSHLALFFAYTPPRFHFSGSQQMLLRRALRGETCEELAASLFISPWTVKKRWRAIYERVADVDSELLPPPIADGLYVKSRGAERRRRLLHYLRQHPEELRPFH